MILLLFSFSGRLQVCTVVVWYGGSRLRFAHYGTYIAHVRCITL